MSVIDDIKNTPMSGGIAVSASAGTGKTYCLVEKVKRLISDGVNPINILVWTFTVDAANELKNRIPNGQLMTIGTIHSVMFQIIREHSAKRYYVLDGGAQTKFIFDILKELKIDFDKAGTYMDMIGIAKNTFIDYYELLESSPQSLEVFFGDKKLLAFAIEYEKKKEHCHKIDFEDMALKAFKIMSESESILDSRHERWKYIFLDEAQDVSFVQAEIVRLLSSKYKNLFVVYDIKQAIYGSFRAGTTSFVTCFKKDYPNASQFSLPTTYRCAKNICDAGNRVAQFIDNSVIDTAINNNGEIYTKTMFRTQRQECEFVTKKAIEYFRHDKTVKILYRTNAQSLVLQQILLAENIPFSINQATSIFYTKEAKAAIAYCKLKYAYQDAKHEDRVAIINSMRPLLSSKWGLYEITGEMKKRKMCPFENPRTFDKSEQSHNTLQELLELKEMLASCNSISDVFAKTAKLIEGVDSFSPSATDNLIGISEFASECKTIEELFELIEKIQKPRLLAPGEKAISLSTIHGSKGLESDVIFLTGVVNGMMPHKLAEDVMEELNLFYVGVTRAKETLYITSFSSFGKNEYVGHQYIDSIKNNVQITDLTEQSLLD